MKSTAGQTAVNPEDLLLLLLSYWTDVDKRASPSKTDFTSSWIQNHRKSKLSNTQKTNADKKIYINLIKYSKANTTLLPVPVCASVFVMARGAQYIRVAQGWKLCQQYPRRPSRPADRPAIGPARWNVGSPCSLPPPRPITHPQSYFISCQFCAASHCSISTWFSTNSAKSPTPTMRGREREKDCKRRVLPCRRGSITQPTRWIFTQSQRLFNISLLEKKSEASCWTLSSSCWHWQRSVKKSKNNKSRCFIRLNGLTC